MRAKGLMAGAVLAAMLFSVPSVRAGELGTETVQVGGTFERPVFAIGAPSDPDLVYVVEQGGIVQAIDDGDTLPEPFLDISDEISDGSEKGLLSIAFPEDHEDTGLFYAYFTNQTCSDETGGCDIEVAEFKLKDGDPTDAKEGSRRTVITIPHLDASNHNGGTAMFGPDGKLWLATGDGGGGNDAFDNASRKGELLGKLLRINPKKPKKGKARLPHPQQEPVRGRTRRRRDLVGWTSQSVPLLVRRRGDRDRRRRPEPARGSRHRPDRHREGERTSAGPRAKAISKGPIRSARRDCP